MNEIELAKKAPTTPQGDPFSRSGGPPMFLSEAGPKSSRAKIVLKTLGAKLASITSAALQR